MGQKTVIALILLGIRWRCCTPCLGIGIGLRLILGAID
jgi:hypothetical protein